MIFIARLFNPYYRRIYQYPKYIQYSLWMFVVLLLICLMEFIICLGFRLSKMEYPGFINNVCGALYGLTDSFLSICLTVLYFRPMCLKRNRRNRSFRVYMSVVIKYGIISTLQLIAGVVFQVLFMVNIYWNHIDVSRSGWIQYNYICNIIQMLDCMLLMICIYLGHARKRTVCISISTSNE